MNFKKMMQPVKRDSLFTKDGKVKDTLLGAVTGEAIIEALE